MAGRAKPVESQPLSVMNLAHFQATVADDSRAQKRRGLLVWKPFRDRIDEILRRHNVLRISAVHAVPGEKWRIAQILFSAPAVCTRTVRLVQPRNAHARPCREP